MEFKFMKFVYVVETIITNMYMKFQNKPWILLKDMVQLISQ